MRDDGPDEAPEVFRWPGGVSWIAHPDEGMRRASHAIAVGDESDTTAGEQPAGDAGVWVVEPVDADGLDDLLAEYGTVAGVVVLAELHRRDAAEVANRHGVPVYVPDVVGWQADRIDAEAVVFEGSLPGTTLRAIPVLDGSPWCEAVLHDPESGTLVATEVLVTSDRTTGPGERLAVGPYARLVPPRAELGDLHVERVLVGHGEPLLADAGAALDHALSNSVRGIPAYLVRHLVFMLRAGYVAMRT